MVVAPANWPIGSPGWWIYRHTYRLLCEQTRYDRLERYHFGDHDLPIGDPRYLKSLAVFQRMAKTNYVSLVNNGPPERMSVNGFKFGPGGDADNDAKLIWSANDMDLQSKKLHSAAAVFGVCYALVGPVDQSLGYPTITVLDPRLADVEPHPIYPTRSISGMWMWIDPFSERIMGVLLQPGVHYQLQGPPARVFEGHTKLEMTAKLSHIGTPGGFEVIGETQTGIDEIPLVKFTWQPDFTDRSLGEAEPVLHIQDRINKMILDRIKIARDGAHRQRWAKGVIPQGKRTGTPDRGPAKAPFDIGSDTLWVTDNKESQFGEFESTDFRQILEAVRDDIADLASISQTPAHYLMNRMNNVSGDTLTQAESGFVSKIKLRMEAMGWGWEKTIRLCFKFMSLSKATDVDASVIWADPLQRKDAEAADAATKWSSVMSTTDPVPLGLIMDHFGEFTADEITAATSARADAQAKAEADLKTAQAQQLQAQPPVADNNTTPGGNSG